MRKFSTAEELLHADVEHYKVIINRFRKSSSLSLLERAMNRPKLPAYRRDRVLKQVLRKQIALARANLKTTAA